MPAYTYDHKEATNPVASGKASKDAPKGDVERIEITMADNGHIVECIHGMPKDMGKKESMSYDYDSRRTRDVFSGKTSAEDAGAYVTSKLKKGK